MFSHFISQRVSAIARPALLQRDVVNVILADTMILPMISAHVGCLFCMEFNTIHNQIQYHKKRMLYKVQLLYEKEHDIHNMHCHKYFHIQVGV